MAEQELNQNELNLLMQQQNQQNQSDERNNPNALYSDIMREEKIINVISQLNPDNLMTDIEHRIRGEKKDPITKEWTAIDKKHEPVSDELVSKFMSFLGSILNQNTSLSNYSESEINNIMEMVIDYVKQDLSVNDKRYGLQGRYTEMSRIGHVICFSVFAVLKRAMNGMEARRLFNSLRVSESLTTDKKGFKDKMLDAVKFW